MIKWRELVGYSIVTVVLIVIFMAFSQMKLSLWLRPWQNVVAVFFAIGITAEYIKSLPVIGIGLLVAVLTILCPLLLLFVIGKDSCLSPLPYFNAVDVLQLTLPTMTAVISMIVLKWVGMRKAKDS